jgi:hypothetical protein
MVGPLILTCHSRGDGRLILNRYVWFNPDKVGRDFQRVGYP